MAIWNRPVTLEEIQQFNQKTLHAAIGIRFSAIGPDYLEATMPVEEKTHQPAGLLHGGASLVLAETLGSVASHLVVGMDGSKIGVGIEISASHLQSIREGSVTGRATPLKLGKTLHFWEIKIHDTQNPKTLICVSRLTVMIR